MFNSRSNRAETFPIDESLSPRVLGRIAAALYVLCGGLVALVGPLLPSMRGTNRLGLAVTGAIAAVVGAVVWQLPWDRWSRSATLWLVPLSFALIGVHNHFTNADGFRYGLFFMVVFTWIGLGHPPRTCLRFAPLLTVAYLAPVLVEHHGSAVALGSAAFAVPICVMVGETVAWVSNRLRQTERAVLESEDALLESERAYRLLFEANPQPLWVFDNETLAFLAVNEAAVAHYGYSREDFLAMTIEDIRPAEDVPALRASLAAGGEATGGEGLWRHRRRDGSTIEVEVRGHALSFAGRDARLVLCQDVTDRRLAEAALRESEERFRSLVQHAHDVVVLVDENARVRYVSPAITHMMGYEPADLVGDTGFDFVHPDDIGAVASNFATVLATPGFHPAVELRARDAEGTWHWLEFVHTNLIDNPVVGGIVINIRDVTERKEAEALLTHQALHDPLTGLANRLLFDDRLAQALARARRHPHPVGVLFLDLDNFKVINDSLGHHAGDEVLVAIASLLESAVRDDDTVARLGGDEFVVCCEDVEVEQATALADRLMARLRAPFAVGGRKLWVTASIGIVLARPEGSDTPETLLRNADSALYRAKERGRARYELFDEDARQRVVERLDVEGALRTALRRGEFRILYHPKVRLRGGDVVGVEALVRWQHPRRGLVLPGEFIGVAEETGLVVALGEWVLTEACRQVSGLRTSGARRLGLSVNLSARQLTQPNLVEVVGRALADARMDPTALCLEITETALMDDGESASSTLAALHRMGVRLALDDFGTGYSSLLHLRRFPIDMLKVDQSFVAGLGHDREDTAIVTGVVRLADALGLTSVAEGVETAGQLADLEKLGCELGQGFYWTEPLPFAGLVEWMGSYRARQMGEPELEPGF